MVSEKEKRMHYMAVRRAYIAPGAGKPSDYSDEWYTPAEIPAAIGSFDLDPCAGPSNHATTNIRQPEDGLSAPWHGRVWLNPPYSNVQTWLERMVEHNDGVVLVNARPETRWFQFCAGKAVSMVWLKGRVNFSRPCGRNNHVPVGSVLMAFGGGAEEALRKSGLPGIYTLVLHPL